MKYSSMVDELIQVLVTLLKRQLDIKSDVIVIKDKQHWIELFGELDNEKLGQAVTPDNYIWINLDNIIGIHQLFGVLVHELVHIKHPRMPHKKMLSIERRFIVDETR